MTSIVEKIRSIVEMLKEDKVKWRLIREKYGRGAQRKQTMSDEILRILVGYPEGLTAMELRVKLGLPMHTAYIYQLLYPMESEKKVYLSYSLDENGKRNRFMYTLSPLQKAMPTVW